MRYERNPGSAKVKKERRHHAIRVLVEENGGTISVTSNQETGTTFTITLSAREGA